MDTGWRKKLVKWSESPRKGKILDCATGTGVLAFEFQKQLGPEAQVTGVDFCEEMLEKARLAKPSQIENIYFQIADIHKLPFADQSFDVCSCAYGLRNVENPLKALLEMARVTKTGGTLMILETGERPGFLLYPLFYLYFRYIVPWLGKWLTGQKSAYEYLQKSSRNFPARKTFLKQIKKINSFKKCEYKSLFFGASFIYKARILHK